MTISRHRKLAYYIEKAGTNNRLLYAADGEVVAIVKGRENIVMLSPEAPELVIEHKCLAEAQDEVTVGREHLEWSGILSRNELKDERGQTLLRIERAR